MEYIVSARKYRPMTFDSVVGKLAHAYLFCGPRGVGKTTCARIFAKVINCQNPTSTGDACGECESCKAFNEGRSLNIFELDAASNNGVEHIKALMEQTRIPPQTGKYKVFIIDEVHMLSSQAFNAFLKTLEEPPAHVIFILATTEKHKILPTIISRCQIYDFERMSVQGIINHLKNVAEKENITYEEEALNVIAEKADGGMRDALSIFEQVASFCQGNITYQKVREDLNILDDENYFRIIDLSLENKVSDIMLIVNSILSRGFELIESSDAQRKKYAEQAQKCKPAFLYKALKILNQCDLSYRQSSNKRLLCELALIQVAQITQPEDDDDSAGRRPCKRLKSLFKKAFEEVRSSVAAQVATTGNASANEAKANTTVNKPSSASSDISSTTSINASATTTAKPTAIPRIKLGSIGASFKDIMRDPKAENKPEENLSLGNAATERETFSVDDAHREWLAMCNRMAQSKNYSALAKRMQNVRLGITEFPNIEAVIENTILLNDINAILPRIQVTMAKYLHNGNVKISLRLAKQSEIVRKLSPREFLDKLVETNKDFASFKNAMQLELD